MKCDSCVYDAECLMKDVFQQFENNAKEVLKESRLAHKPDVLPLSGIEDGYISYVSCSAKEAITCWMEANCSKYERVSEN